jgi:sugar lactone lactonase YvrE
VAVDAAGNVLIADSLFNYRIRRVDSATQKITTVAGNGTPCYGGDGGAATFAELCSPSSTAIDSAGDLFIADSGNQRIRRVDVATGVISTVAGIGGNPGFGGDGGPATSAAFDGLSDISIDSAGNLFIADTYNERIRRLDASTGVITTVAGNGYMNPNCSPCGGFAGDGGPATSAELNNPEGVTVDHAGNLFIADTSNQRVRRVDAATQIITTVAGNGTPGSSGNGGPATSAEFYAPAHVSIDLAGDLFITDWGTGLVRRVDAVTGVITTVAGGGSAFGAAADGGPATSASLIQPYALAIDAPGNLFFSDGPGLGVGTGPRVRRVDAKTQIITTFAGNGTQGFSGDGGPAALAQLGSISGLAFDSSENLFIADGVNSRVREVIATKQEQTISFAPIPDHTFIPGGSFVVSATASSGLPVSFSGGGNSCTISGVTVEITSVGSCIINAEQGGNSSYKPAPEVSQKVHILYAPASQPCLGAPGHTILPPINSDNTSIFNQGRTVPAKFRVCDGNGNSVGTPGVVTSFNVIDTFSGTHSTVVSPPTGSLLRFLPSRLTLLAETNRSRWSLTWAVLCLVTMVMIFIGRREKHRATPLPRRSAVTALTLVLAAGLVSCGGSTSAPSATNAADPVSSVSLAAPDTQFRWDASDQQWIFNVSTKGLAAGNTYVYRIALNDGTTIVFQFGLN